MAALPMQSLPMKAAPPEPCMFTTKSLLQLLCVLILARSKFVIETSWLPALRSHTSTSVMALMSLSSVSPLLVITSLTAPLLVTRLSLPPLVVTYCNGTSQRQVYSEQ